jgi:hypothetical protein
LKVSWENEFTESIELFEEEVERWIVRYINTNDEVDDTLHQSGMELREMDNELFKIKTKHEITVVPMREYFEDWLRKYLIKIIEPEQQEIVATFMPHQPKQASTKEAPSIC